MDGWRYSMIGWGKGIDGYVAFEGYEVWMEQYSPEGEAAGVRRILGGEREVVKEGKARIVGPVGLYTGLGW